MNLAGPVYFKNDDSPHGYGLFTRVLNINVLWLLNFRWRENSLTKDYFPKVGTIKISSKNE